MKEILFGVLGFKDDDGHLKNTPLRVATMFVTELFSSLYSKPPQITEFKQTYVYDQMIITKQIPIFSVCAHHLLPFYGTVSIGYIPDNRICGLSKFARVTDYFSRKPQVQENLTAEIADYLEEKLKPKGLGVIIRAKHLCMEMRGVQRANEFVTTALKGNFYEAEVKDEFLRSVGL